MRLAYVLTALVFVAVSPARALDRVPACRLDDAFKPIVLETLQRAIGSFRALDKALAVETVEVNPEALSAKPGALDVYLVRDAAQSKVTPQGCASGAISKGDELDAHSVRGGCIIVAVERMEMRCSLDALRIFSIVGQRSGRANPTLLYVLSHELAHVYQRRIGEYEGRAERIELGLDTANKIKILREACDPASTRREEEADAISIQIIVSLLRASPYREPVFSERGSFYWNVDLLAAASDTWRKTALEREFISQPKVHASFIPTEFPTPPRTIDAHAKRFVCDVLTKRKGAISYPSKSVTHPPLEQRLRRIAEALRPIAETLPNSGAQQDFLPLAHLQQDVSPIFTQIYRETGVYLEALQDRICTMVNGPKPYASCR